MRCRGLGPPRALTLPTFLGNDTPSCTDIAHILGTRYPFAHWHCILLLLRYPFMHWHCTQFWDGILLHTLTLYTVTQCWDEIPLCALTLHTFLGWDTPLCTDVEHILGTRCRSLGQPHALTLRTFDRFLVKDCCWICWCCCSVLKLNTLGVTRGNAIVHWQLHSLDWEDCKCAPLFSFLF